MCSVCCTALERTGGIGLRLQRSRGRMAFTSEVNSSQKMEDEHKIVYVKELRLNDIAKYDINLDLAVGTGTYGAVFVGTRGDKKYALKFFGYTKGNKRPDFDSINREIMLMMSLIGCRGAVQLESIFYDSAEGFLRDKNSECLQSYPVIVMEYIEGGSLFEHIIQRNRQNKPFSEKYLARIFRAVVVALQSIHEKNHIHRDLKVSNVLLLSKEDNESKPVDVKIIDFGFMQRLDDQGAVYHGPLHGTEHFLAPESITERAYSVKSDIWQLGCLLYMLLCVEVPFKEVPSLQQNIITGNYTYSGQRFERLSESAKELIFKIFTVNPSERYSITQILEHSWLQNASDSEMDSGYAASVNRLQLLPQVKKIIRKMKKLIQQQQQQVPSLMNAPTSSFEAFHIGDALHSPEPNDQACALFFNGITRATNKDSISREEFIRGVQEMLATDGAVASGSPASSRAMCPAMKTCVDDLVKVMDLNNDGEIQYREFRLFFDEVASFSEREHGTTDADLYGDTEHADLCSISKGAGAVSGEEEQNTCTGDQIDTCSLMTCEPHLGSQAVQSEESDAGGDLRPPVPLEDDSPNKRLRKS